MELGSRSTISRLRGGALGGLGRRADSSTAAPFRDPVRARAGYVYWPAIQAGLVLERHQCLSVPSAATGVVCGGRGPPWGDREGTT